MATKAQDAAEKLFQEVEMVAERHDFQTAQDMLDFFEVTHTLCRAPKTIDFTSGFLHAVAHGTDSLN